MEKLITLDVRETSITKLPQSLGSLTSIETLQLKGCRNLVCLPYTIVKLKHLIFLNIIGCSKLSSFPEIINEEIEALEELEVPTSNSSIWSLPRNPMFQRPSFPKGLTSLRILDLSGSKFVSLPDGCISNLLNLKYLYLNFCPNLQFLPQPSPGLNLMDAGECGSLRTLSDQKFLQLFSSMEQDGQHVERLRSITNFSVTIPGSEIPSWFENQNHLSLNEKHVASVTIDIPEDEWLGIGLCTVIDDNICLPHWGFDFKASDGKYVSLPGRTREYEKEIKSSHLWIVFWKISVENRDELLRNYSQIHLKFSTDWEQQPPSKLVDVESIKLGWCFIYKGDSEQLMDDGKKCCSEAEEQEQWSSLSTNENPQITIDRCEATSQMKSSPCLEEIVKSEDSQMQLITHHACHHDFPASIAKPAITKSSSSSIHSSSETCPSSSCCSFDDKESTISIFDSIDGTQVLASRETNHDVGDTLVPNIFSIPNMSGSKQTSAEEILKELSQVPDLSDSELVQIYILLTENEREYESFKALPTPLLRKLWISTQIKRYYC